MFSLHETILLVSIIYSINFLKMQLMQLMHFPLKPCRDFTVDIDMLESSLCLSNSTTFLFLFLEWDSNFLTFLLLTNFCTSRHLIFIWIKGGMYTCRNFYFIARLRILPLTCWYLEERICKWCSLHKLNLVPKGKVERDVDFNLLVFIKQ